jgi:phosphoglycolate phosphatase-like HAD superfamily hydrolase
MRAVILSERTLADTDEIFAAAVVHLTRKLGRVKPLDPAALPSDRAEIVTALDAWAGDEVDWRGELARFYEDHIPLHLRPNSALNSALRQLRAAGIRLACWSPGPDEAAQIVVHQLGLGRRIERIGSGGSADVAVLLADELAPSRDQALVVADDAGALAHVARRGAGAAAALWTGAEPAVSAPVAVLRSPADMVALVLGETAAAR